MARRSEGRMGPGDAFRKASLVEVMLARGSSDLIDTISSAARERRLFDVAFKPTRQGVSDSRASGWIVWLDEEAPFDLFIEALTRTNETNGSSYSRSLRA